MNMTQPGKSRREMLEAFVASNPNDAFTRYGLAIECANQGDHEAAITHFRQLLVAHPDYVTGYFQFGQLLARLSRTGEAKVVLSSGIAAAERAGDSHARDEMRTFLQDLG